MEATWKKWACFLMLAAAAGLACHFLAKRHLLETPEPRFASQAGACAPCVGSACPVKEETSWHAIATRMLEHVYLPWPLWPLGPELRLCTFDPNNPKAADGQPGSIIDVLHRCCAYRDKDDTGGLAELLANSGRARDEALWTAAQAISEILPPGDKEKQLLQGLLNQRERIDRQLSLGFRE